MSLQAAIAAARSYAPTLDVGEVAAERFRQLYGLLEGLFEAEKRTVEAGALLGQMAHLGVATPYDYRAFDIVRSNLLHAQLDLWAILTRVLAAEGGPRLPAPSLLDSPPKPARMYELKAPPPLPARLPPPRGLPPIRRAADAEEPATTTLQADARNAAHLWAAGVILAILGVGMWLLAGALFFDSATDTIARVLAAREQSRRLEEFYQRRLDTYRACLGTVTNPTKEQRLHCIGEAGLLVPTPSDALPEEPSPSEPYKWIVWTAVGLLGLGAVYGLSRTGFWSALRERALEGPRRFHPRALPGRPREVSDLDGPSDYHLEIE